MIGSLCSGYGGLEMGVAAVLGGEVAWHAEIDPGASAVLAERYPGVANLGDLSVLDWNNVPSVDVVCAGFPCQPVSTAGLRKASDDDRWLWPHIAKGVRVLRPRLVVLENVPGLLIPWRDGRWWRPAPIEAVLGDLAAIGYDAQWRSVRASDVGAPHRRQRVFIVATDADLSGGDGAGGDRPDPWRWSQPPYRGDVATDAGIEGLARQRWHHDARGEVEVPAVDHGPLADADGDRRQGRAEQDGGPLGAALDASRRCDAHGLGGTPAWGPYTDAIGRWERVTGTPAPAPVDERGRLSARFVEWMMGLPAGWVTDVAISRTAHLKILGNGVVPQQAAYAIASMVSPAVVA